MTTEIIKNPAELQVIKNPTKTTKTTTTMAKDKTTKALGEYKNQAITAAQILGGQAIGAQLNALVVPNVLGTQNATIQQVARAGIPAIAGVLLTLSSKNEHVRGVAMGMGVQSALEVIKFVMPDWSPQNALGDSSFIYTDENGERQRAVVTPNQELVTSKGEVIKLNAANGKKEETSKRTSEESDDGSLDDYFLGSDFIEDDEVEWI